MFDYVIFCLRTFYSRLLFFIFPQKLSRLKEERNKISEDIKMFIDKFAVEVDPNYYKTTEESELADITKDDISYLETRFQRRQTKSELLEELKLIDFEEKIN